MTEPTQLALSPRDQLLQKAIEEMVKFEKVEREFRRRARKERAAELGIPVTLN